MGKSNALGIIGIILAAGAIGFGFFVWVGQNTTTSDVDDLTDEINNLTDEINNLTDDFNNLIQTKVVGIWDALYSNIQYTPYDSQDDWLFYLGDNNLTNTDYISVSNNNTRITLLTSGWYRIHLHVLLKGISPVSQYWGRILENGAIGNLFYRYQTSATPASSLHHIDSSLFVYSNGTKYIEIEALSNGDDFDVYYENQYYNQFKIEYIAT